MADDISKLMVLIEANTKAYENAMKKVQTQTDRAMKGAAKSGKVVDLTLKQIERGYGRVGASISRMESDLARTAAQSVGHLQLNNQQLANMQFQIQDLGVQLASGQSPFMAIIQQGSQIGQMFGPGSTVTGALRATGAGILTFLTNPINLAIVGFGAAAAIAPKIFEAFSGSEARSAEDTLKTLDDLLSDLEKRYEGAAQKARDFLDAASSPSVIESGFKRSQEELERQLDEQLGAIRQRVNGIRESMVSPEDIGFLEPLSKGMQELVALADHVSAKQITVDQFKQTLADIELAENTDDDVRELARELDKLSDAALKTASSIGAIGVATAEMRRMASVDPLRFDTDRKSRSEIMADLAAGLRLQSSRLTGPKAKKTEAEKERERAAKAVERQKAAIRDYLSELEHENRLIGLTSLEQEKLNVLRRLGAHATDAQRQEALNWTEQNYRLRDSLQAAIDAEQLFATAAFDSILAVTDGTKSASDAMEDFARSIARAALQATLLGQGPLAGLFGTSNPAGGVGGILGAVFGGFRSFDGGGYTGMAPRVGGVDGKGGFPALLHPNETVIDHSKGRVAANQNSVVELRLSGDVEARILRKAGNQSVQITRQASPGIARQGADMAQERYGRQGGFESL